MPPHAVTTSAAHERALERVKAHMPGGKEADAQADAIEAAKDGEFGLITTGDARFYSLPTGAVCFTPGGQAPNVLRDFGHGDYITPDVSAQVDYAAAYNATLVEQAGYPFRDLCRASAKADSTIRAEDRSRVTKPARDVTGPPHDVFEAARRGSARDVRKFLKVSSVDSIDGLGMTALAWAVARDNRPAIDVLLSANANPWAAGQSRMYGDFGTAVYWSAALGRGSHFDRLANRPARPFDRWPTTYISAAMDGGDPSVFEHMLNEPHEAVRIELLRRPLPDAALFELVLKQQPDLADPLLFLALDHFDERPELLRLALARGANANALRSYETPLAKVSTGISKHSLEAVDMLLKAGANPNLMSHRVRPVWVSVGILHLDPKHDEFDDRATAVFHRLIAAGADLNLPDWQGRPPIWTLLFPYTFDHSKLDASFVTPDLLELLVKSGLDLNAPMDGERVLGPVEAQAGRDSELAHTLRRLGAKP